MGHLRKYGAEAFFLASLYDCSGCAGLSCLMYKKIEELNVKELESKETAWIVPILEYNMKIYTSFQIILLNM